MSCESCEGLRQELENLKAEVRAHEKAIDFVSGTLNHNTHEIVKAFESVYIVKDFKLDVIHVKDGWTGKEIRLKSTKKDETETQQ